MVRSRIARLRQKMREEGLDAFLVSSLPNIRYLSNFSGSNALCIVRAGQAVLATDSRYREQSREEVRGFTRTIASGGLAEAVSRKGLLSGCRSVGFEASHVTYAQYRNLKKLFPRVSFRSTSDFVESISRVKDEMEIDCIQQAVDISDTTFKDVIRKIKAGITELDIAAEISYLQKKHGGEGDAFDAIVASGVRGALPHARPTSKRITGGEFITMDFGCTIHGYSSDLTRTVALGRISRKRKEIYDTVLEAQCEAVAAARGGIRARDLDAVARNRIRARGYNAFFTHSLGHGLGLHVHERPRISSSSEDRLIAGNVITIEPGVYIPGFGGVRIEDDVLLHDSGCRVLNASPKELIIL